MESVLFVLWRSCAKMIQPNLRTNYSRLDFTLVTCGNWVTEQIHFTALIGQSFLYGGKTVISENGSRVTLQSIS